MRRPPAPVLATLLTAVLLTGCSGGTSDDAAMSASLPGGASSAAGGQAAATGVGDERAGLVQGRVAAGPALIRTAELTVRVDDVRGAADRAAAAVRGAGGSVESEERSRHDDVDSAALVLRVPPDAFDATLGRLAALGEERSRRLDTQDVTEQVVDLDSRISTQRASVERVRALLERARSLGEIVQVEAELTKRTADLESLQARLAALDEQVDLARITLRLEGDGASAAGGRLGFSDGLRAGWGAVVLMARAAGVAAGAVLPFTPLLLVAGGLVWRVRSRARRAVAA